eukprot:Lithocolla_globosa_v1_NODE_9835_length_663_cov_4.628289.p2 type:complete len:134 gc:universal NODE_9835_length_663_cov_4.628289:503-102(-)
MQTNALMIVILVARVTRQQYVIMTDDPVRCQDCQPLFHTTDHPFGVGHCWLKNELMVQQSLREIRHLAATSTPASFGIIISHLLKGYDISCGCLYHLDHAVHSLGIRHSFLGIEVPRVQRHHLYITRKEIWAL